QEKAAGSRSTPSARVRTHTPPAADIDGRQRHQSILFQSTASCGPRELTVHGLLPDVGINISGDEFLFLGRKRRSRETGKNRIQNENLNVGLGLFLLPEAIKFGQSGLDRRQQLSAGLLHPLARRLVQTVLLKQIKQRQFVLVKPFLGRAL